MKMICSQILFLTAISVCIFHGADGFHNFQRRQQPQDLLYLNVFYDDVLEQDGPIGYKVPVEEIEFTSDSEEKTTKPKKEDVLNENKVKFVNDKNGFTEAELTTSRLKEVFTTSNTNTWNTKAKTNEKMSFKTDLYGPVIDIQSPPKLPTPEPCTSISDRFTSVYLKAITNLIQHILNAFFATNLTPGPKPETELNGIFDSKPLRQIKKRDISKRDKDNVVNTEEKSTSDNTEEITQNTERETSNSKQPITNITIKDSIASNLHETTVLRKENEIVPAQVNSSGSSKLKETTEKLSTNDINISASSSHSTMVSEHPTTVTDKEAASNMRTTTVSNVRKGQIRVVAPKDVISIDDLINDEGTLLNSLKITSKELHDVNPHPEYNNPNLVQHPLAGDKNPEGSTNRVVMVVTGTILVVLILVSIGAAVAYAVQKRYLSSPQMGNQNSSNQRAAMA